MTPDQRAVAARAASVLLRYPDPDLLATVPAVRAALPELPDRLARPLATVTDHLLAGTAQDLAASYVETFDFRRRCCLYLTYYTHGDTRARGAALADFAAAYRIAGLRVDGGELPDFLPAVLEFAAATGEPGWDLLRAHRVGVDLLADALAQGGSVYRYTVEAVRTLLPAARPADAAAARRLAATGPPAEQVGLDPFPATRLNGGRR